MFSLMTTIPAFCLVNLAWILTLSEKLRLNRPNLGIPTVLLGRIRVISSFQAGRDLELSVISSAKMYPFGIHSSWSM